MAIGGDFTGGDCIGGGDFTDGERSFFENIDCIGAWIKSLLLENGGELIGIMTSLGNIFAIEGFGEVGSGEVTRTEFVSIGLRRGDASLKLSDDVGEGDLTGDPAELVAGDTSLRMMVEEMVFLAACLARSVLTKLVTSSSRFPLRLGEASSSRGPTSVFTLDCGEMWVMDGPLAGLSRVDEVGEEKEEFLGEEEEELRWTRSSVCGR